MAAIAVPQYQKAVLKADIHRGVSLINSLYEAQQVYFLTHGEFAADIDNLDVSFPKDSSCKKSTPTKNISSAYDCDFGRIFNKTTTSIQFQTKSTNISNRENNIAYAIMLQDSEDMLYKAGKRYCYAKPRTKDICINMGGTFIEEDQTWAYYALD